MTSNLNRIVNDLNGSGATSTQARSDMSDRRRAVQQKNRVLDPAARSRRTRQQLAQLERDNFHDDPHANLVMHKKAPKFNDSISAPTNGSAGRRSNGHARLRTSTWQSMLDEDLRLHPLLNFITAAAPSPDCVKVLRTPLPIVSKPVFSCSDTGPLLNGNGSINGTIAGDASIPSSNGQSPSSESSNGCDAEPVEKRKKRTLDGMDKKADKPEQLVYRTLLRLPARHFCCVCGFRAPYTCVVCGMRYCCSTCLGTHKDTRCLKWTA